MLVHKKTFHNFITQGRLNDRMIDLEHQHEKARQDYEAQLNIKNRELLELQDAYKEKLRKCQAWEKVQQNVSHSDVWASI